MTRIKLARELSKLTRAEAAEKLGVPYTTYANWKMTNGNRRSR